MTAAQPAPRSGLDPEAEAAIRRALVFLRAAQLPSGELPVSTTTQIAPDRALADRSVFPTALAAHSLSFAGNAARPIVERALVFLCAEMDRHGLWRHWPRSHPLQAQLPPDLDDTSCASEALARCGMAPPANRALLLANRNRGGLFRTWLIPRLGWRGAAHARATLPQLRHPAALLAFFRCTSARAGDIDAVVNANAIFYLGAFEGRAAVVDFLLAVLRAGREEQCDKWYDNPFAVRYFLARAIGREPGAAELILERAAAAAPASALESALAICTYLSCGTVPAEVDVAGLLALQASDGSWPRAALYHGGRARLRREGFAPPHPETPRWGSEALTTAFAVEALARRRGSERR